MSEENQNPPGGPPPPPPSPGGALPHNPPPHNPPPPHTPPPGAGGGAAGGENRTLWLVCSYLWLLALIPFFVEKNDREVQWHAKHGLVLLGAEIALWVVLQVLSWGASVILGPLMCFGCFVFAGLAIAQIVLHIACIMKALKGERLIIPGLSHFADQF